MMSCGRTSALLLCASLLAACAETASELPLVGVLDQDRLELIADARERIVEVAVAEGAVVAAGEVLLRLDSDRREAELKLAQARHSGAEFGLAELIRGPRPERIRQARARLLGARENLAIRTAELSRLESLITQNLTSAADVDRAKNAREAATAEVDALSASLDELLEGTTAEELGRAESAVAEAEARVRLAELALDRLTVRAPVDVRVDVLPYEFGERPPAGATVAIAYAAGPPFARVYVPEGLRARIAPGQAAVVDVDGVDGVFNGRVRYVSAEPTFTPYFSLTQRDRSRLAYVAEIELTAQGTEALVPGLPVEVDFPALQ